MGLLYLFIVNILFLYALLFKLNKNYTFIHNTDYKVFYFYPYLLIIFIHLIYFFFYFYSDLQLWIYGNTINSFSDATSFVNQDKTNKIFENIHNIIEGSLGGHEYVNKSTQFDVIKNNFSNSFHAISYNEDPEPGFIFFFILIKSLFNSFSLMHSYILLLIVSIISLSSIYRSINILFDYKTSLFFLILLFFYIPYFNSLLALYHHFLFIPAFAIYLIFLEFSLKKKYPLLLLFSLSLILSFLIVARSSLIIFIPSILLTSFLVNNNFLNFSKLFLILFISFFSIQTLTIDSSYNQTKDGVKYGSHVFWYTFFTGLGETQKIVSSAEDGVGFNLAYNDRPDLIPMTEEWDIFFKVNSLNLINENKKEYIKLILYRINKVYLNKSNWKILNINKFKVIIIEIFFSVIYFLSIIFLISIFIKDKIIFYKIFLFSIPVIINSNLIIFIFSKNFYYYFAQPFVYFLIFSYFISTNKFFKNQ